MEHSQALGQPGKLKRLAQAPLVRMLLGVVIVLAPLPLTMMLLSKLFDKAVRVAWPQLLAALVCFLAYRFYVRKVERRALDEFSTAGALRELGAGMLGGLLLAAAVFGVLGALGLYQVDGVNDAGAYLAKPLAELVLVALFEEMLMRGVVFRSIEQSLGSWLALLLSGLLFGLMHAPNEGATLLAVLNVALAGVLFAAAYMATRRLWLPIGIHFAWNYSVGQLFSGVVSGHGEESGLLAARLGGPGWLSGGTFGVEASAVTLGVLCAGTGMLLWLAKRRGHVVAPGWRRK